MTQNNNNAPSVAPTETLRIVQPVKGDAAQVEVAPKK
jgi:hypothetical protein